jgi:hypothetical protein
LQKKEENVRVERLALDVVEPLFSKPFQLQKADGSKIHKFNESLKCELGFGDRHKFILNVEKFHCFVVQHDLAMAFANVDGFTDGDFNLPYDDMIFEFCVSGLRVMLTISRRDGETEKFECAPYVDCGEVWASSRGSFSCREGKRVEEKLCWDGDVIFSKLIEFLWPQVRAVCIALDAEVVTEDVVRAPHALNKAREKAGKTKLVDYSVIRLLHTRKSKALEPSSDDEKAKRRLHFVRGHWRHYVNHKAWIKWFLRGDIDLGIIEQKYIL